MQQEELHVTIDPLGQVHIEVRGTTGLECLTVTKDLESALGGQISSRTMKPEAYESTSVSASQHVKSRR